MANDKKDYLAIVEMLLGSVTLSSRVNTLSKVHTGTEDQELRKLIAPVYKNFKRAALNARVAKAFPLPAQDADGKALIQYCQACVANEKPQWQILAERAGWTPPL